MKIIPLPIFTAIILLLFGVVFIWLIPNFADVYAQFGSDLPYATKIAVQISEFLCNNLLIAIIAMLLIIAGSYLLQNELDLLDNSGRMILLCQIITIILVILVSIVVVYLPVFQLGTAMGTSY